MKKTLTATLLLCLVITAAGQTYGPEAKERSGDTPPVNQRLFFGGSFGLQFGTVTNIQLAPLAGIWLLPRLAVGAGPSYHFYKDPFSGKTSIYGGRAMLQITLVDDLGLLLPSLASTGIFVKGEYEALSLEKAFFLPEPDPGKRMWDANFLLGGGISQKMGRKSSMNILFLWCVTGNRFSLYDTPEIKIEFYF